MSFLNDLKNKDTNLFPIVIINREGNMGSPIYLSTNSVTIANQYYQPLLLNIPGLKESIDVEKTRRYKISNVSLSIINYEHDGARFSERVGNSSLINQTVDIYWVSPSVTTIDTNPDTDAYKIYSGWILRYELAGDERVTLIVEDRSQAKLHKDLPIAELGHDESILSKYRGAKVPMVFGAVDKSPCIVKINDPLSGEYNIYPDKDDADIIIQQNPHNINNNTTSDPPAKTYLDIFRDTEYVSVLTNADADYLPSELDILDRYSYADGEQYTLDPTGKSITVFNKLTVSDSEGLFSEGVNPIGDNFALVIFKADPETIKLFQQIDNYPFEGEWELLHRQVSVYYTAIEIAQKVLLKWYNPGMPSVSQSYEYAELYKFFEPPGGAKDDEYRSKIFLTGTVEWTNTDNVSSGGSNAWLSVGIIDQDGYANNIQIQTYDGDNTWLLDNPGDEDSGVFVKTHDWGVPVTAQKIRTALITGNVSQEEANTATADSKLDVTSFYVENYFLLDKFIESDFYANVHGREMSNSVSPTVPEAIKNIMEEELGVLDIDLTGITDYSDWKYAFTIDKKINSKRLLEGIASASPFIPRYNNKGDFVFDVIKDSYNTDTESTRIEKADCISWSAKRTKIESVYTKIIFSYNWDYGKQDFNSSVSYKIKDTDILPDGNDYHYNYYGFTENDDSDSTLTVDDDRGKYIRDETTAKLFTKWLLRWHCNMHLIIKIKLSLKYMEIEVGSLVSFERLGDADPYGINYSHYQGGEWGDILNGQQIYPLFLVTSTSKSLTDISLECIQLHNMTDLNVGENDVIAPMVLSQYGEIPWNADYNPDADISNGEEVYASSFVEPGCPVYMHPAFSEEEDDIADYSSNFAGESGEDIVTGGDIFVGQSLSDFKIGELSTIGQDALNHYQSGTDPIIYLHSPSPINGAGCTWQDSVPHELTQIHIYDNLGNTLAPVSYYDADTNSYKLSIPITQDIKDAYLEALGSDGNPGAFFGSIKFQFYYSSQASSPTFVGVAQINGTFEDEMAQNNFQEPLVLTEDDTPSLHFIREIEFNLLDEASTTGWEILEPYDEILSQGLNMGSGSGIRYEGYTRNALDALNSIIDDESLYMVFVGGWSNSDKVVWKENGVWTTNLVGDNMVEGDIYILHMYNDTTWTYNHIVFSGLQWDNPETKISTDVSIQVKIPGVSDGEYTEVDTILEIEFQGSTTSSGVLYGDMNGDGVWNVLDVVTLANCALSGTCPNLEYSEAGDMNGDGVWNVLDVVTLANCALSGTCDQYSE